jgi:imidazoleglycerol-phosphate dehydratase/histidinol-phosphatase
MSKSHAVLFIDRDGTLVVEPPDEQLDRLDKIELMPGVIPALAALAGAGFRLVLVSNQDGLGTDSFPEAAFRESQDFLRGLLASQGIHFDAEFFCPHRPEDACACRKPRTGLLDEYLAQTVIDRDRSYVIGDRDTDQELATNLGIAGLRVRSCGAEDETWPAIARHLLQPHRRAELDRRTRETEVRVRLDLDAENPIQIRTGLGFFDHMLEQIAKHGGFSLALECNGDLHIDEHHTVEDCALTLGTAIRQALGDKRGIARYGFLLPMDEARAEVALDLSGRPFFVFDGTFHRERVGELPTELVPHFFRSLAESMGAALHIKVSGENTHHMIEACFKAVGRSLRQAFRIEGRELPSSKGVL